MNKLPVGQTIRFAYAFTFGEIGTVIGLIWIPTLINAVLAFFGLRAIYDAMADMLVTQQPPADGQFALWVLVLAVASVLLLSMISVAIVRQAMGLRQGPAYAHLSLGAAELRVFGGFFGLYMLLLLFFLAFMMVAGPLAAAGSAASAGNANAAPIAALGVSLVIVLGLCALLYGAVRLSFLMVPAAVDGSGFGLARSWQLTKGNFWNIFVVGLATLVPLFLVLSIVQGAIMGPEMFAPPDPAAAKDTAAQMKDMAAEMRMAQSHLPMLMGLSFVVSPLLYGLLFAPAAFAYRVLSGKAIVGPAK